MLQQTRAQAAIPYYQRLHRAVPHGRGPGIGRRRRGPDAVERPGVLRARPQSAARRAAGGGCGRVPARVRRHPRAARRGRLHRRGHRQHGVWAALRGGGWQRAARGGSRGERCRRHRFAAHPRALPRRGAGLARPAPPRAFQPGPHGARRHRLSARQAAVPGLPALARLCRARESGTVLELPVKLRKTRPVRIAGALLLVRKGRRILLRQREAGARRMAGFWDLPAPEDLPGSRTGARFGEFRHTITHHHYTFTVLAATARRPAGPVSPRFRWFDPAALTGIPLSTTARKALKLAGIL